MAEPDVDTELLDYEDDEEQQVAPESAAPAGKKEVKGSYVSIHSSGFRDFLLKPELLRAIVDCGFEHPSEGEERNGLMGGGTVALRVYRRKKILLPISLLDVYKSHVQSC